MACKYFIQVFILLNYWVKSFQQQVFFYKLLCHVFSNKCCGNVMELSFQQQLNNYCLTLNHIWPRYLIKYFHNRQGGYQPAKTTLSNGRATTWRYSSHENHKSQKDYRHGRKYIHYCTIHCRAISLEITSSRELFHITLVMSKDFLMVTLISNCFIFTVYQLSPS